MKQINLIHSFYPSLTRSEKKICDYLFANVDVFVASSIQELSSVVQVGEATIVRLCQKVGFSGYLELKQALEADLNEPEEQALTYIDQVSDSLMEVVRNTRSLVDPLVLEQAIDLMYQAERISFFGVGFSGLAALEAQASFLRLGVPASAFTDSHFQAMQASAMSSKDVVVAISLTGSTVDTVFAARTAKEAGGKVIALTNYIQSPLAKLGDCVLLTAFKENMMEGGSLAAKVSQLCLINMLRTGYSRRDVDRFNQVKSKMVGTVLGKNQ